MDLDKALLSPLSPTIARQSQSFSQAAHAMDDLTSALHEFSTRSPPPFKLQCCCGREDCPMFVQWLQLRAKLENDLMLSAGIGQGLLHRHEEYVRRHEASLDHTEELEQQLSEAQDRIKSLKNNNEELLSQFAQLAQERAGLDKRLNQVLLNLDMSDASNKALLKDLDESRNVLTNLSVQNAKSLGFEARLRTVEQERDDMREESRVQGARADAAESKATSLSLQCSRLQSELHALREGHELFWAPHEVESDNLEQERHEKLQALKETLARSGGWSHQEVSRALHDLTLENQSIQHENEDLRRTVADSHHEIRVLNDEIEQLRHTISSNTHRSEADNSFQSVSLDVEIQSATQSQSSLASRDSPPPSSPLFKLESPDFLSPPPRVSRLHNNPSKGVQTDPIIVAPEPTSAFHPFRVSQSPVPPVAHSRYGSDATVTGPPSAQTASRHPPVPLTSSPFTMLDTNNPFSPFTPATDAHPLSPLLSRISASLEKIASQDTPSPRGFERRPSYLGRVGRTTRATLAAVVEEVTGLRAALGDAFKAKDNERDFPSQTALVDRAELDTLLEIFMKMFEELSKSKGIIAELQLNQSFSTAREKPSVECALVRRSAEDWKVVKTPTETPLAPRYKQELTVPRLSIAFHLNNGRTRHLRVPLPAPSYEPSFLLRSYAVTLTVVAAIFIAVFMRSDRWD